MRFHGIACSSQRCGEKLLGSIVRLHERISRPFQPTFASVKPYFSILAGCIVMQQPANFKNQCRSVFKADKSGGEVLYVHILQNTRAAPHCESVFMVRQGCLGSATDRYRLGMAHEPES